MTTMTTTTSLANITVKNAAPLATAVRVTAAVSDLGRVRYALSFLLMHMTPTRLAARTNLSLYRALEILLIRDHVYAGDFVTKDRLLEAFFDVCDGNSRPYELAEFNHHAGNYEDYLAIEGLYHDLFEASLDAR